MQTDFVPISDFISNWSFFEENDAIGGEKN